MANLRAAITSRLPRLLRWTLECGQRFGVNITPNHFYSEIPNFRHLRSTDYWRKPMTMRGILGSDVGAQIASARACTEPYLDVLRSRNIHEEASRLNGEAGFGRNECDLLYCFIRSRKPAKIIQVGCGVSTVVATLAAADEPEYRPQIVCVEPYPTENLKQLDREGKITLLTEMAQTVALEKLSDLEPGDLLFVDSTHTLKPGSEVPILIGEVLPRLVPGVYAHFHDIAFPYNYNPFILDNRLFYHRETTMLYAYLVNNPTIEIDFCMSMMQFDRLEEMKELLPNFRPGEHDRGVLTTHGDFPESVYLRVLDPNSD
jgi:predicted O-methyltransferase YrrM